VSVAPSAVPATATTDFGAAVPVDAVVTEEAMRAWAHRFVQGLPSGAVVALHGPLGAGKTTLVRMLCEARGVRDLSQVTSPTFALIHEYAGVHGSVVHADLYRLRKPEELEHMGWDDLLARAALTVIEWPEQGGGYVPPSAHHVFLDHVAERPDVRRLVAR
jgi:tRNA threonylcarbamoyladenosine biosynthesis protein TsaE